ncbi:hypothetical protein ABZ336_27750, partial [Streptomyces griseorubiginosus]
MCEQCATTTRPPGAVFGHVDADRPGRANVAVRTAGWRSRPGAHTRPCAPTGVPYLTGALNRYRNLDRDWEDL